MNELLTIKVRNHGLHSEGYWIAEVSAGGPWVPVHRKFGSWMFGFDKEMKDILPEVAAELQIQTIKAERKGRQK